MIGLLTAGGEWEELVVVVLAMLSGHPGLAVGNVVGSCLANLIGSMPLGFFGPRPLVPDRSARVSSVVMLVVTLVAAAILADGYAIGATVVVVDTTLPNKAISFIGGRRGQGRVVTANATGSNIFVLTLVLGLAALTSGFGLTIGPEAVGVDLTLLVGASLLVILLFRRPFLHRGTGAVLLALYVAYLAYALGRGG